MQNTKKLKEIFIGIDISKDKFDVYIHPKNKYISIKNNKKSINFFINNLKKKYLSQEYKVFIGMEATGIYHKKLFEQLSVFKSNLNKDLNTNLNISIINPKKVHNFFKSFGDIAKTDKKDAKLIALFMERIKPRNSICFNKDIEKLKSYCLRRTQIVNSIRIQKNYLESYKNDNDKDLKKSIIETIAFFKKKLKEIELFILNLINNHKEWKEKKEILESVPGIGKVSIMTLLSNLPELGTLDFRKIVSLVGLAPKNRDSGRFKGKRTIIGGRKIVRDVLYMGVLSSIRVKNNVFANFYNKLRKKGKCAKVAIIAVMRKMIIILNSMIKYKTKWKNVLATEK